ncbi:MAG: LacI family DNA-binding transcriptional regulator [Chloroflexota bacterium]
MAHKNATSYDVAKRAGVSQATVSRAFDPNGNVSAATRAHIMEVAKTLGYQPNQIARSLSMQRTDIVGIIMGNMTRSYYYPSVLVEFTSRLQEMGKQVLLFNASETGSVDEIMPRILSYQVDALIIASTTPGREIIDEFAGTGTPVVMLNRTLPDTQANAVVSDNVWGGRSVADYLYGGGHTRFGFMTGVEVTTTNAMRRKGFIERLAERGVHDVLIEHGSYSYRSGHDAALRMLDREDRPDALFCAADVMALGAMDAARFELGINIPDELSVVGYDDIPMAGWPTYDLTTVRQSAQAMSEAAIDLITPQKERPKGKVVLLPGELIERGSARRNA